MARSLFQADGAKRIHVAFAGRRASDAKTGAAIATPIATTNRQNNDSIQHRCGRLPQGHAATTSTMHTIRAKNVTPSIMAAVMIMAVWMLPATSGWRAMLSTAHEPILPMP